VQLTDARDGFAENSGKLPPCAPNINLCESLRIATIKTAV
jgi:hypothetical protein